MIRAIQIPLPDSTFFIIHKGAQGDVMYDGPCYDLSYIEDGARAVVMAFHTSGAGGRDIAIHALPRDHVVIMRPTHRKLASLTGT